MMKLEAFGAFLSLISPAHAWADSLPRMMEVILPVADLRREPSSSAGGRVQDFNQETQLLYGEKVLALERRDAWVRISAIEQLEFKKSGQWQGYPGWVRVESLAGIEDQGAKESYVAVPWARVQARPLKESKVIMELSLGSRIYLESSNSPAPKGWVAIRTLAGIGYVKRKELRFVGISVKNERVARGELIRAAQRFLGGPYYWGGRSFYREAWATLPWNLRQSAGASATGVDCSALVNLAYRISGVQVPRDAHEQFLKSRRIDGAQIQAGDLIFLADPANPDKVIHVMLYAGRGRIIEAAGEKEGIRRISVRKRLGRSLSKIQPGGRAGDWVVYFGSFFKK